MKIAVVGAGAVGTYYGARLAEAGHEVGFVIRSEFELVSEAGITVLSKDGDIRLKDPLIAPNVEKLAAQFEPDWVLCGLKATALDISQEFPIQKITLYIYVFSSFLLLLKALLGKFFFSLRPYTLLT